MMREVEKWSGIQKLASSADCANHDTKFQWNRLITFAVILPLHTDWINYRRKNLITKHPCLLTTALSGSEVNVVIFKSR